METTQVCFLASKSFTEKTFIGLFGQGTVFSFEGCVCVRVLAGAVEVEGHLLEPSQSYHSLFSPLTNSRTTIISPVRGWTRYPPTDLDNFFSTVKEDKESVFVSNKEVSKHSSLTNFTLKLVQADVQRINHILNHNGGWGKHGLSAILLFRDLCSPLVSALDCHFVSSKLVFPKNNCRHLDNFRIVDNLSKSLSMSAYRGLSKNLMASPNPPVILVCGRKNVGKSTLSRFLLNQLLNRYSKVMFLECDVGQSEFTVSGVVSLHCITEPIYGPSYAHIRKATRAYFFGETSPNRNPDLYLKSIEECMSCYHDNHKGVPLIANTCGYTSGLGILLFHDIVSIVSPTHIVQLRTPDSNSTNDLPLLTPECLSKANGWRSSLNPPSRQTAKHIASFVLGSKKSYWPSAKEQLHEYSTIVSPVTSDDSDNEWAEPEVDMRNDRKRRKDVEGKFYLSTNKKSKTNKTKEDSNDEEESMLHDVAEDGNNEGRLILHGSGCCVQVITVTPVKGPAYISGRLFRLLSSISYFSPLLSSPSISTSERRRNFVMAANPYQVPWSAVAIHCIHERVSSSHILYAINGAFVALGRVKDKEITDSMQEEGNGVFVKCLKSCHPLVEFLGLGLVRGVDFEKKLFYVTTPETSQDILAKINCLVMGNTENSFDLISNLK